MLIAHRYNNTPKDASSIKGAPKFCLEKNVYDGPKHWLLVASECGEPPKPMRKSGIQET